MNCNLPPIGVYVRDSFLLNDNTTNNVTWGYLVSVRSLQNQSLQFTVLLETGALYTGLPAHSLCFTKDTSPKSLELCQMWDNISSSIDVVTLDLLRYMPCSVKLSNGELIKGIYKFTIDYCGENDLSRDPVHWKQAHCIEAEDGTFLLYPQYRIQFLDKALCFKSGDGLPKYKYNEEIWFGGS